MAGTTDDELRRTDAGGTGNTGTSARAGATESRDYGTTSADSDPEAIRAHIRETRGRMSHTLDEIGERLNPQHLKEQVTQSIHEATIGRVENMARNTAERVNETRRGIMETVSDNPVPAAMVAIGLGWLIRNARSGGRFEQTRTSSYRTRRDYAAGYGAGYGTAYSAGGYAPEDYASGSYATGAYASGAGQHASGQHSGGQQYEGEGGGSGLTDRAREAVGGLADRASDLGQTVRDRAGDVADRAQELAGTVTDRTQDLAGTVADNARMTERRLEEEYYDNPLVIGAATVALGLAAGFALPSTHREAALMGGARDRLIDRVREVEEDMLDRVETVAERAVSNVQSRVGGGNDHGATAGAASSGNQTGGRPAAAGASAPSASAPGAAPQGGTRTPAAGNTPPSPRP